MNYSVCDRKLLFIEDDERLKKEIVDYFSPSNVVYTASDVEEAVEILEKSGDFDAVVLDLILKHGMLAPYVADKELVLIENKNVNYLRTKMKEALPNHILYDLRTTFYSRLKECGVADNAINEYVGHSLGILENTYTDLSDEYLLKEGKKFKY